MRRTESRGGWRTVAVAVALAAALAPAIAVAEPEPDAPRASRAHRHLERGLALYQQGDYRAAVKELEAGYAIERWHQFLLLAGSMSVEAGECAAAIDYLERYLASAPQETRAAKARAGLERCRATDTEPAADAGVEPAPETSPGEGPTPPVEAPPVDPPVTPAGDTAAGKTTSIAAPLVATPAPRPRPWIRDPIGGALAVTGIASTGAGVVLFVLSRSSLDRAERADDLGVFHDEVDTARWQRQAAWIAAGAGAALIAAGVTRYALVRHRGVSVSAGASRDSAVLEWMLRF